MPINYIIRRKSHDPAKNRYLNNTLPKKRRQEMKSSNNPILEQIVEQSRYEPDFNIAQSCLLRECFDMPSHEWKGSTMEEKVEALKVLVNEEKHSTYNLARGMHDYCNHHAGKDIELSDLVVSLSKIIDHLLKKEG